MKRRVVITGVGTVNATGMDTAESWASIKKGIPGIGPITHFDTTEYSAKLAFEVKEFHPERYISTREIRRLARFTQFALCAAGEAMDQSGLHTDLYDASNDLSDRPFAYPAGRAACLIASGIGGLITIEEEEKRALEKGIRRVSPFFVPESIANMAAANVSIRYKLQGMCECTVSACTSSANAIGDAFHRIRDGYEDAALAGGTEAAITPLGIAGFQNMMALSKSEDPMRACIPFDQERNGFVMGEGAAVLVLEEREHALRRGAGILAEIVGYGTNADAFHITSPDPEGAGPAQCMNLALEDAGISADVIDYINMHGTSTHLNDSCETKAVKRCFGDKAYRIPVSSTKSMTGHLLGAAGAMEALLCVLALHDGFIPATVNYRVPDPECDLDVVPNEGRKADLHYVMSNSLGFGGHNASLIFRKAEA